MDNKLEYFPCLELQFEWNLTTQIRRNNEPSVLSTKFIYQENELFRIGVKKPYSNSFENVTFFLLTTNLKQLGLKIKEVSFTYQAELDNKRINKEMNLLKTSNNEAEYDETEVIQLFTAPLNKEYYHRDTIGLPTTDLTVHFTVYFIGITENYRVHPIDGLLSQELLSSVTNQDDGVDFKLIAKDGKSVNVHKWILAARSPIFAALFNKEDVEENHIMDCTLEELNQLITFIYTGELPEGQAITLGLMQLAVRYQIKTLESIYRTASTDISLDKMATLALHLEPGYRKQQLCSTIYIGTCKMDAEFETKFGNNVSFYVCTWNVLPLIKIWTEENKEISKINVPFEFDKKRLFRAEFEMRRNPPNKSASFIRIRFLSYASNSDFNEVIFSIDQNNGNGVVRGVMFEEPTHDKQLVRLFTIPEMNLNDIPSFYLITFNIKLRKTFPNFCNKLGDLNWGEELWASAVDRKMTDVLFLVGEEIFSAHRSLLSARSPVFAAMFASGMKEASTGQVCIKDIDPITFRHFLKFLYTGMLESLSLNKELFSVADKYRVETLMELCRSATQTVDMDDIINIFFSC